MRYYLGIDNGGTTTKAALYDSCGKEICVERVDTRMILRGPGRVERDMEEMWAANCSVISRVLEKSGVDRSCVAGVGVCGHGKGLYLWGRDGRPARNGIMSADNRAYGRVSAWRADGTEREAYAISCQRVISCQPAALLAWIRNHEPHVYKNIKWIFECKDYVRFRLTGEARAEMTDYSGANLLNLYTRAYDDRLLQLFGIEDLRGALPPLCRADEICGYITEEAAALCGLMPGTPVTGGMFDIDACALAAGIRDEDTLCMIAGTWSINEYICRQPVVDDNMIMNSLFCLPGYYLVEESSPTSAGNLEWFVRQLLPEASEAARRNGVSVYDEINSWVEAISPCEPVPVFLPFLMGSNVHPNARGSFIGLRMEYTRAHMARSIYEGVVFSHRYHMEKLEPGRNRPIRAVRLAGGAARSRVWAQMFADVLKLPVEIVNVNETGTFGCAIAVAAAVNGSSLEEAEADMCRVGESFLPREEFAGAYDKKYELYLSTIDCLGGLWDSMQTLEEAEISAGEGC